MRIIEILNALALPIMVLLSLGVIIGVVKIRSILFYIIALLLLPFVLSAISQTFSAGVSYSRTMSWKMWAITIFIGLIVVRLIIDRVFRRK